MTMSDILLFFGVVSVLGANVIGALLNNKGKDEIKDELHKILLNQSEIKSEVTVLKNASELQNKKLTRFEDELSDVRKQIREIAV